MSHDIENLPPSDSTEIYLTQATPKECVEIWKRTSESWRDALTPTVHLEESSFMTTAPLARDGNMTTWILTVRHVSHTERPILCSCESFRTHALVSDMEGHVKEGIVHKIASVFCAPQFRNRGYASRHMKEMARVLRTWQCEESPCIGSVLYSDIGKSYYAKLGWGPNATNNHMEFLPEKNEYSGRAERLTVHDLPELCRSDQAAIRRSMAMPSASDQRRFTILPTLDHMLWHMSKEDFASHHLFNKTPLTKGAIAGLPGRRVWAIWTHRYYHHPDAVPTRNVLYILRLVLDGQETVKESYRMSPNESATANYDEQIRVALEAVIAAARAEAADWRLGSVHLWDPSPLARKLIRESNIQHKVVDRETGSIASGLWYNEEGGITEPPVWINNEHYAWC